MSNPVKLEKESEQYPLSTELFLVWGSMYMVNPENTWKHMSDEEKMWEAERYIKLEEKLGFNRKNDKHYQRCASLLGKN